MGVGWWYFPNKETSRRKIASLSRDGEGGMVKVDAGTASKPNG
jgi:hypothetical protein